MRAGIVVNVTPWIAVGLRRSSRIALPITTVQKVIDSVTEPPPGETTHWTGRVLAKAVGISLRSVQRILEAHQLAPHRIRTFKLSNDPKFADKVRDVVGLPPTPSSSRSTRRAKSRLSIAPSRDCR
jgi:hypothetical protein